MVSSQSALRQRREPHIHIAGERCPVCDQPIPNERAEEVRARMEERERALAEAANARAAQQFANEKAQIEANANTKVEIARREYTDAVKKIAEESSARETAARAAGKKEADAVLQEKLAAAERAKAKGDAAWKERIAALEEATKARDTELQEKVAAAERDKQRAVEQCEVLKANQEQAVNERVQEVREAMEKANANALGAERAKHFEERQKLTDKLEDFKRQLERKTSDELGEGAEVDLFDALKGEFENDKIERIGKGSPGADVRHVVIHNGKICGTILYDSKNRGRWLNDYVEKLARDQRAAKAEHAILSTLKFPEKMRQVHVDRATGVIIANPARVLALVQVLRKHLVHLHSLRLSNAERGKKTAALYDFVTSERYTQILDSVDTHAEKLLNLQIREKKAHDAIWRRQGMLCRSIQKARADVGAEIDRIIEGE